MELINNYSGVLLVITLILGAGVYIYGTVKRGRTDIVRQDNADLRSSNQELRSEKAGYIATITQQSETIKGLREVATQTPAVTQLLEASSKQQAIAAKQHGEVIKQLSELAKEMSKMTGEFSRFTTVLQKNSEPRK